MINRKLRDQVSEWIAQDPDPQTRDELRALVDADAADELADRFSGFLQFGTAGLRGELGGGPNRMNRVVVRRAAAGLAAWLIERSSERPHVVVGFDARRNSRIFAEDTAAVMTAAGVSVSLFDQVCPTPVVAYTVRSTNADAGVMVTASHNPPNDNGYKVYVGGDHGGAQIVVPFDAQISEHIAGVGDVRNVQLADSGWATVGSPVIADYTRTAVDAALQEPADLRVVYTAMHGVGGAITVKALHAKGFHDVHVVEQQHEPDPSFSTVSFPNPEEDGAMDLALGLANEVDADLVIANDPDADRCAGAVYDRTQWRMLTGDELGVLFGLQCATRTGKQHFANSVVSSRLLEKVATARGIPHHTTLTGFKWIARTPDLTYGYEEALGYCIQPWAVLDKDGISAAVMLADIAWQAKQRGKTVLDLLDDAYVEHGVHLSDQVSMRVKHRDQLNELMHSFASSPPPMLGSSPVITAIDLAEGHAGLPPTTGVMWVSDDQSRVVVRPSGTEPKLKCYLEVVEPVANGLDRTTDLSAAKDTAQRRLAAIVDQIMACHTPV